MPAPPRLHPELRSSYSRHEIFLSLKMQIERDGGTFILINLNKNTFHWLDKKGNKHVAPIEYN